MHCETLPGAINVDCPPLELLGCPTIDVMRAVAPDIRVVLALAEAYGFEPPPGNLRDQADAETAAFLATQLPAGGAGRAVMLA